MPQFNRIYTESRRAQGFKSQEHLDAFYAHYDHVKTCPHCHALNGHALLDDGYQPTQGECQTAKTLDAIYWAI